MSMKKWLAAAGIVGLLVIAFFWGGNSPKSSYKPDAISSESPAIHVAATTPVPDKQPVDKQIIAPIPTEEIKQNETPAKESPSPVTEPDKKSDPTASIPPAPEKNVNPAEELPKTKDNAIQPKQPKQPATSAQPATPSKEDEPKKDKYLTDPIPEGKPKPVEWQDVKINKKQSYTATLSVTSKTILDHMSSFNKDKLEVLPADGVIYKSQSVTFYEGESVFDVLLREMRKNKIHMEFSMTPIYNSNYIEGINNIYEFDCGELSGWMYKVNEWFPNYGASRYMLKDGDVIDWVYTCDLGRDIAGGQAASGGKGK